MQVEDHPFDYGEFEGVIPKATAQASSCCGTGTWKPEADDIDAALKKGELKFALNGSSSRDRGCSCGRKGRFGEAGAGC